MAIWVRNSLGIICLGICLSPLKAEDTVQEWIRKVHAHLLINDKDSACETAQIALQCYPEDQSLWQTYLIALSKKGDHRTLMLLWPRYAATFSDAYKNDELLEEMAWGVIQEGSRSTSLQIRVAALLGALFGQDSRGVALIDRALKDRNALVRTVAVKIAGELRDTRLCDSMRMLLRSEKSWQVSLEAIKSLGSMQARVAKADLIACLEANERTAEEKAAAIQALLQMTHTVERPEIEHLVRSSRAGLRLLGCKVIAHCGLERDADLVVKLLNDPSGEVQEVALFTLGILRTGSEETVTASMTKSADPRVAITATWLLTQKDRDRGHQLFNHWLAHEQQEVRLQAAAALGACGKGSVNFIKHTLEKTTDPYVRINLSLSLIGQRTAVELACDVIYDSLTKIQERWMWREFGAFRALAPSNIKYLGELLRPEAVDQTTRLELLNLLAVMQYPHAQDAVVNFLQNRTWGITGVAAACLLTEGNEEAVTVVKEVLKHPDHKIRLQAALILALWGREPEALGVLEQGYAAADREMKERILEGIGRVGARESIPFLVDQLNEHYQSLRVLAAAALLQCLNH